MEYEIDNFSGHLKELATVLTNRTKIEPMSVIPQSDSCNGLWNNLMLNFQEVWNAVFDWINSAPPPCIEWQAKVARLQHDLYESALFYENYKLQSEGKNRLIIAELMEKIIREENEMDKLRKELNSFDESRKKLVFYELSRKNGIEAAKEFQEIKNSTKSSLWLSEIITSSVKGEDAVGYDAILDFVEHLKPGQKTDAAIILKQVKVGRSAFHFSQLQLN